MRRLASDFDVWFGRVVGTSDRDRDGAILIRELNRPHVAPCHAVPVFLFVTDEDQNQRRNDQDQQVASQGNDQ